jgi:hypothetical protein
MWDMFMNSLKLFLRGKLFKNPAAVFRQWLIGFTCAVVVLVAGVKLGLPLWLAVAAVAIGGGVAQPFLFKNLKYA